MLAAGGALLPLGRGCDADDCVLGCVEDWVGGVAFAFAVVGGVDMPFGMLSAVGEAIVAVGRNGRALRCGKAFESWMRE